MFACAPWNFPFGRTTYAPAQWPSFLEQATRRGPYGFEEPVGLLKVWVVVGAVAGAVVRFELGGVFGGVLGTVAVLVVFVVGVVILAVGMCFSGGMASALTTRPRC